MQDSSPLRLFNSLTRQLEEFKPQHDGKASVYSCGPTVYNYQHIGNMRAYVFADTLGRVLSYKGYQLNHVINITDVGHLTSDADAGDDKMEKAAAAQGKTAWDIAAFYQADFEADLARLNIRKPQHPKATDYVPAMIDWAKAIADKHCYELESGLYFDMSTVPDYGRLARAATEDGEGRIDAVDGKRHAADFAIWRKTPPGETRQMEWDSPWGRGAPGWHLECSVMSQQLLGHPFDIHTGGIDHREIHHPNEIAQNQAHGGCDHSGATIWMHNNFLIDRRGKMSKSSGEFLRLQTLIDRGFHPLAYRLMCLQAHYRSEMEFTWEGLLAAQVRLKRILSATQSLKDNFLANSTSGRIPSTRTFARSAQHLLGSPDFFAMLERFDLALSENLNTPLALTVLEQALSQKGMDVELQFTAIRAMLWPLGLRMEQRKRLRKRPANYEITPSQVSRRIAKRDAARAAKDFVTSDRIRDDLIAAGVEVMDGDPLGWDWRISVE